MSTNLPTEYVQYMLESAIIEEMAGFISIRAEASRGQLWAGLLAALSPS